MRRIGPVRSIHVGGAFLVEESISLRRDPDLRPQLRRNHGSEITAAREPYPVIS
jgi:hypothetical protein